MEIDDDPLGGFKRLRFNLLNEAVALRKKEGLCVNCNNPRGENGTTVRCRTCADRINKASKEYRKKKKPATPPATEDKK